MQFPKLPWRWPVAAGVLVILVIALLVRRYDPPFDGSSLLPTRPSLDAAANAYPHYVELALRLRASLDRDSRQPLCAILQDPTLGWPFLWDLVRSNEHVFAELDMIQILPFSQPPDLTSFRAYETNTYFWADLSTFLYRAALVALQYDQPGQATRCALQLARFARHWLQYPESRAQFFLALSAHASAHAAMRRIAADPQASVEHLRALLGELQDANARPDPFHQALQAEYEIQHNTLDLIHQSHGGAGLLSMCCGLARAKYLPSWLKGELFYRHHRTKRMLYEWFSVTLDVCRHDKVLPDAARLLNYQNGDPRFENTEPRAYLKSNYIGERYVSYEHDLARDFLHWQVHQARLRLTRTVLALHLYRKAHGAFPENLSALCPEFLAEIPSDPLDGSPIHFAPELPAVFSSWPVTLRGGPVTEKEIGNHPPLTQPSMDNGATVLFLWQPDEDPTPQSVTNPFHKRRA